MADAAWGVVAGVIVAVLLVVVVEIGVVELLVVGFGGLRLLELLLLRLTGNPLHVTALAFRPLGRSIQQPCQGIGKCGGALRGLRPVPLLAFQHWHRLQWEPCPDSLPPAPRQTLLYQGHRLLLWDDSPDGHVLDREGHSAHCPYSTCCYPNLGTSLPTPPPDTNLLQN